jgi:hypothetical protein
VDAVHADFRTPPLDAGNERHLRAGFERRSTRDQEIARLERKLERSEAELAKMKRVVEIQGNVSLRREAPCGRR